MKHPGPARVESHYLSLAWHDKRREMMSELDKKQELGSAERSLNRIWGYRQKDRATAKAKQKVKGEYALQLLPLLSNINFLTVPPLGWTQAESRGERRYNEAACTNHVSWTRAEGKWVEMSKQNNWVMIINAVLSISEYSSNYSLLIKTVRWTPFKKYDQIIQKAKEVVLRLPVWAGECFTWYKNWMLEKKNLSREILLIY